MPGVSKAQRAEAKYNVVLDFPDYGLHTAAASANLGLVKYALDNGQPVNSALDGVLPLHAACSGGNDLVVRLLIEHGADVNAPRIPRRYSNDKHRTAAAQLVISGASGSTPLHFAAAQGHTTVVLTLLLHGAHPDRPDKHGVTPEMLARQNGFTACADVLREWCHNKDKDLREREAHGSYYPEDQTYREKESHTYCGSLDCKECATRKRIRMKRSIDNAIHILRHSSSHSSNLATQSTVATPPGSGGLVLSNPNEPPSPLDRSFGEYTFYSPDSSVVEEPPARRPSLPQVLEVPPHAVPTSHRSRRPSNLSVTSTRRPRSAGNDAEPSGKVKGKISLLNLFKKGTDTPDSLLSSSSSAVTSVSTSPAGGQLSALAMTSLTSRSTDMLASTLQEQAPSVSTTQNAVLGQQRLDGSGVGSSHLETPALYHSASRDSLRGQGMLQPGDAAGKGSSPVRPGILLSHGRSSSGQSASQPDGGMTRSSSIRQASGRSLRFDSSPSEIPSRHSGSRSRSHSQTQSQSQSQSQAQAQAQAQVRGQSQGQLLPQPQTPTHVRARSPEGRASSRSPGMPLWGMRLEGEPEALTTSPAQMHTDAPHGIAEVNEDGDGDEEEEYGHPVQPQVGLGDLKARLSDLALGDKARGAGKGDGAAEAGTLKCVFECPFSINRPPSDEPAHPTSDTRTRGDSLSSMATDTSGGPPSSAVPTPAIEQRSLPGPAIASPSMNSDELLPAVDTTPEKKAPADVLVTPLANKRSRRTALDINISGISTHAQAEALVQRAQQRIFDLDTNDDDYDEAERKSLGLSDGHTPLSARLAAYGESLAIERQFKQREGKRRSVVSQTSSSSEHKYSPSDSSTLDAHARPGDEARGSGGLDRQRSFREEARAALSGSLDEQRPHSSGGTPSSGSRDVFLSVDRSRSNALSTSNPEHMGRLYSTASVSSHSLISPPSAHQPAHYHHHKMRSETLPTNARAGFPRSRTPDPDATLRLSQSASFGAPLARHQTCPIEDSLNELVPHKASTQARQAARAQKLARMGFLAGSESWRETSELGRGANKQHRFGGIKTLVQSLTGRT